MGDAQASSGGRPLVDVKVLAQLAETKRVLSAVEAGLQGTTPACVVVTSAARSEGKTTAVAGLAAVAASRTVAVK